MRVRAPGKVMIAGEYAVLEGATALVMAVDRYAYAHGRAGARTDASRAETQLPIEATAALEIARTVGLIRADSAVSLDVTALSQDTRKLGLGSSAAGCVAALGAAIALEGGDLDALRPEIARIARRGHRTAQGGGSGVDVVASAVGGVSSVSFPEGPAGDPVVEPLEWPHALRWAVLWTGVPVRTSDLIRTVKTYAARAAAGMNSHMDAIREATDALAHALRAGDVRAVVAAVAAHNRAMDSLGRASDTPIVTDAMRQLAAAIEPSGAALKPSGAGGGDIALVVAQDDGVLAAALAEGARLGFVGLDVRLDRRGVATAQGGDR